MACIFCDIISGALPCSLIYEDKHLVAFHDIHPKTPVHCLVIPKIHIATLNDTDTTHTMTLGYMLQVAKDLAQQLATADQGYRVQINCNAWGGQEIDHLHLHLLGGRPLDFNP